MVKKTEREAWLEYRFLSKEMLKFLRKQEMELFYGILEQREQLQAVLEQTEENGFKISSEGQSLFAEITQWNEEMRYLLGTDFQGVKKHHQVAEAYNQIGSPSAGRFNWQR